MRVEAASKPTINKKSATIKYGKKVTLKVKNASKKVKWSVNNPSVLRIISTKGAKKQNAVFQGLKKGTATVTAKVGSTKLKVKVKVKHTHSYTYPATCTSPAHCVCGATYGPALGHQMSGATCKAPSTCSRCGYKTGSTVAHSYGSNNRCIWCNRFNLASAVSFTLSNTSVQGSNNVRYIGMRVTNRGAASFTIQGAGTLRPSSGAAPITLYITDADDKTYLTATCYSQHSLTMFYDTMDNNTRFTFLPGGTLTFSASYGGENFRVTLDMYGNCTFVSI